MEYKKNTFGVTVDYNLTPEEIAEVHRLWRQIRDLDEWQTSTWNVWKEHLGLQHEKKQIPNWTIKNKEKWLWAKLKYGI